MTGKKTANEMLNKAADYLETHEWLQHKMWDDKGGACLLGAMETIYSDYGVSSYTDPAWDEFKLAYRQLYQVIGTDMVACWNDQPGRTKEQVVKALREASENA